MNQLNLLDRADKLALLETFIQVVKDETLRDRFGEILELNDAELFRIRDLAEKIMKAECETSDTQPDEGDEIELRPDQYSDNFEDETRRYIESALAVELDDRDITEDLHNIMDIVAGVGERHFGIPEIHSYAYTICEKTPVVLWSRTATLDANNVPMWWSDNLGWTPDLDKANVFTGALVNSPAFVAPRDHTCAVPLRDAEKLVENLIKVEA
jgi:hypothetical protein